MEPVAFLEIVDRHEDVLARHAVYRWPLRIGRGYDADVILDDAFVAPLHLEIAPAADGRFVVTDPGSLNGAYVGASEQRIAREEIGPDDLVRLGHTQIRIRPPSYAVPAERRMRSVAFYRRPVAFVAMAAAMIALVAWNGWITVSDEDDRYPLIFASLSVLGVMAAWIGAWSFVSSAIGRRPNFSAHGSVACAGMIAVFALESLFQYLSFGLDAGWLEYAGVLATAAVFAYMIYRHLVLNSRAMRRSLMLIAAGVSVALYGISFAVDFAVDVAQQGKQRYNESIKAPAFLFAAGTPVDAFMAEAEKLKTKIDSASKRDAPSAAAPGRK